ncbi:MAG: hypothetical protein NTU81_03075 [Candidatus Nomurabacteria bacterium]|nr:hypothetical protein [Candidatus Nomurabacteria bacterium]
MFLLIIVGVGIGSFSLGRISTNNSSNEDALNNKAIYAVKTANLGDFTESNDNTDKTTNSKEKMYVASKNGKIYYSIGCSGAKRIKPINEVWFSSAQDAEKSGFKASASCK